MDYVQESLSLRRLCCLCCLWSAWFPLFIRQIVDILCYLHLFVNTCHCISQFTRYIFLLPIITKDWRWRKLIFHFRLYNWQQNCWDIVLKWGNFGEHKNPHPPPLPPAIQSWGVCCFLKVAWTVSKHCLEGMGEEKLSFPLWKSGKHQKVHLRRSASTHFVTDCSFL